MKKMCLLCSHVARLARAFTAVGEGGLLRTVIQEPHPLTKVQKSYKQKGNATISPSWLSTSGSTSIAGSPWLANAGSCLFWASSDVVFGSEGIDLLCLLAPQNWP